MTLAGFSAVIFDMDGVLVDGEPLHFRACNALLGEEGLSISLEAYKPYMGTKAGWSQMMRDLGLTQPAEVYSTRYDGLIVGEYRANSLAEPGAVELVTGLKRLGMPIAVASSSRTNWVAACLERIGLLDQFDHIISGSDIEHGKPAPDIYLLAADRLGVVPQACLAIEDAPAGIESARAAGMTCWAVRTEYTRGLRLPDPHREFDRIGDIRLEEIMGVAA
jgi:HAD superfamily hydrolase (TIGR01509 family)